MTISSQTRKAGPFNGNDVTTAFPFTFKVFSAADVYVVEADDDDVESVLVLNSDYTVSLNANQNTNPGGTVTLGAALATGHTLVLTSAVSYLQPTDLTNQGGFYPKVINDALDRLTILVQQTQEEVDRSAKLPITSAADAEALVADIVLLADNVTPINTVAGAISSVQTVATNIADVNAVAAIAAEVNTVGDNIAAVVAVDANETNINAVAADEADIGVVAGAIANVNSVASNIAAVVAVDGNETNINAVVTNATNINTVAGIAANVTTVAGNTTNINAVAGNATNINAAVANATNINATVANATNINTVAGIAANVTTVAGIAANVTTVAGIAANVTTVAADGADIGVVAGAIADVSAVAGVAADVATAADNIGAIIAAPAQATAAAGSATNALNSANAAAASAAAAAAIVNIASVADFTNPLARAIRVALTASTTVGGIQVPDNVNLDMGTNGYTPWVQKRITTTRPAATEVLYRKHDGTNGVIIELLTTGAIRTTINGATFTSTSVLPSATNVCPLIMIPVARETASVAGSVTFVVDGVQLGNALAISARVEKITNGSFDTDLTGWTLATGAGGTVAWNAGQLRVTRSGDTSAYQAVALAAGETLFVSCAATYVSGASATASLVIRSGAEVNSTSLSSATTASASSGTLRASYYSASAATVYVHLRANISSAVYDFDVVTSIDTHSVDNAVSAYLLGTSTTRTEGDYLDGGIYNRTLTVAECLTHYKVGPAAADVGTVGAIPSQSAVFTSDFSAGTNSFSGVSGATVTGNQDGVYGVDNTMLIESNGGAAARARRSNFGSFLSPWTRIAINAVRPASNATCTGIRIVITEDGSDSTYYIQDFQLSAADTWETFVIPAFSIPSPVATGRRIAIYPITSVGGTTVTSGDKVWVKDLMTYKAGIIGWWNSVDAQSRTGQILDSSGNKLHGLLPPSGATVIGRPIDRGFEVRSELTWSASSALQYLTGINQAILDADAVISEVLAEISGTPVDGTLGDGSDADRYCTLAQNTGLIAGFNFLALAARTTDGTNLKLTWTPSASFTGTITFTVRGFIRE